MSLTILQNAESIAPGGQVVPFSGSGGTAPYVYSVLAGGAGGTINASTGYYTSPTITGVDTVRVTDSLAATADTTISIRSFLELVCDIIQTEMSLSSDQVYLWDQKFDIPKDSRLYVAVGILSCKPFSNTNQVVDGVSIQSTNFSSMVSIDIMSRGASARDRKEEVIMALNSTYAEQQQELNSFRVFPLPVGFVNLSEIDGAAIPYRFNITVAMQYFVTKQTAIDYYDDFSDVVIVSDEIQYLTTEDEDPITTEDGDKITVL